MTLHPFLAELAAEGLYTPPSYPAAVTHGHGNGQPPPAGDPGAERWAAAALAAESDELARTAPGTRNARLNHAAFRMGQVVALGYVSELAVADALLIAAQVCGLPPGEAEATLRSGLRAGQAHPRQHVELRGGPEVSAAYTVVELPAVDGDEAVERPEDGLPPFVDWARAFAEAAEEPEWLIPDVLEKGRSHALYAPKKVGKSLVTLTWCGRLINRGLHVLYVDVENSMGDLVERLRKMQRQPEHLDNLHYVSFPSMAMLDTPAGGATLLALVEKCSADLVILDTVSRVISGEENSADTFRNLYRYALVPLKALGLTVLRLDHAGKDTTAGQRGSSAKGDDVDTIWRLIRHDDTHYQLKCDAQRSGHHPEVIELVKRGDPKDGEEPPMRFERIDPLAPPEVTALIEQMDRLGLPGGASNRVAREALRAAGVAVRNSVLAEAVRSRQIRVDETILEEASARSTTDVSEPAVVSPMVSHLVSGNASPDTKINLSVPQDQLEFDVSPARPVPGTVGERGERDPGSPERRRSPTPFPPKGERGTPPRDHPRTGPEVGHPEALKPHPRWRPSGDPDKPWLCERCQRPAERLIGPSFGRQWCPVCAYPNPADRPGHTEEENE